MSEFDFDAVVIGAGAVGLATGYALSRRGLSVVVIEREKAIGQGVSARNSEVVHAGLYYPTGSLKARLCVEGRRLLYPFLDAHNVAYDRCGKLVVATEEAEIPRLDTILEQAKINDVEGMRVLTAAQTLALEPEVRAVMALESPESGVFDSHGYMVALQGEIEAAGGAVVVATPFLKAEPLASGGFRVLTGGLEAADLTCRYLVTCAGLGAQEAASYNNHQIWYTGMLAGIDVWLGDTASAVTLLQRTLEPPPAGNAFAPLGMQIAPDGELPAEEARTNSGGYVNFATMALLQIGSIARTPALVAAGAPDLLSYVTHSNGSSIKMAVDYMVPYVNGSAPWPFQNITRTPWNTYTEEFLRAAATAGWEASHGSYANTVAQLHPRSDDPNFLFWPLNKTAL